MVCVFFSLSARAFSIHFRAERPRRNVRRKRALKPHWMYIVQKEREREKNWNEKRTWKTLKLKLTIGKCRRACACVPWSLEHTYTHFGLILNRRTKTALSSFILFSSLFRRLLVGRFKTQKLVELPFPFQSLNRSKQIRNIRLHIFSSYSMKLFFFCDAECFNKRTAHKMKLYNCILLTLNQSCWCMKSTPKWSEKKKWDA